MANFFETIKTDAERQLHNEEIKNTRIGGLGGSDAAMVLRVVKRGLDGLTATDTKRLCVMMGVCAPQDFGGNAHTLAGHLFEDYADEVLPFGKGVEKGRETYMEQPLAKNFKTFAHADFTSKGANYLNVIECKYVQKPTEKVLEQYHAQLQWYYMLGASQVTLYHGTGMVDPFEIAECKSVNVERDEQTIKMLIAGIKLIDEAITSGWMPMTPDKAILSEAPSIVMDAFAELSKIKDEEAALKARKDAAVAVLKEYVEGFGYTGIVSDDSERQLIYTKPSVSRVFDSAKFLKEHPEYNDAAEYWKETKRASSVSMK